MRRDILNGILSGQIRGVEGPLAQPVRVVCGSGAADNWCEISHHVHLSTTVDEQVNPSCVGWGTANAIEMLVHMQTGKRIHVDGRSIWKRGREMFWNGTYDGGLLLEHGFAAAYDLGLLPEGATSERIPLNEAAIIEALKEGPLICAHSVHDGWGKLHPENQAVDESCEFFPGMNGHCTCLFASDTHNGVKMYRVENSWGGYGFAAMSSPHFFATAMDEPLLIKADFSSIVAAA